VGLRNSEHSCESPLRKFTAPNPPSDERDQTILKLCEVDAIRRLPERFLPEIGPAHFEKSGEFLRIIPRVVEIVINHHVFCNLYDTPREFWGVRCKKFRHFLDEFF
jgi:hypothetical protein